MKKLGDLLLERGWVDRGDLLRAMRQQQRLGGRLGTCLLEMGAVSEEELSHVLGIQHGIEPVSVDEIRQVPEEVRQLLSAKFAVRCQAVPVKASASKVHVAMLAPQDLAHQDELAFAVGRRLILRAVPEVRLLEALERYYDEPMPRRVSDLVDRLNRSRFMWREEGGAEASDRGPRLDPGRDAPRTPGPMAGERARGRGQVAELFPTGPPLSAPELPTPPGGLREAVPAGPAGAQAGGAGSATPPVPAPGSAPAAPDEAPDGAPHETAAGPQRPAKVALSENERAALYGGRAPAPVSYEEAEERLGKIGDREEVATLILDFLRQEFERVILFAVRRGEVTGWAADGESLDQRAVEDLAIPLSQPSIFLNLQQGSAFHLGPLPALPAHRPLVAVLGGEAPDECLLLPVHLGDRMVVAIYADRDGRPLGGLDLEALRHLADAMAHALERCILLKRQAQT